MRTILVLLLALDSLLMAQGQGSVFGVIRDAKTHAPIQGVRVVLEPYEAATFPGTANFISNLPSQAQHLEKRLGIGAETTTDSGGAFSFGGVAAKRYCLTWQKEDYWPPLDSECSLGLVRPTVGRETHTDLTLDRSASISLQIVDDSTGALIGGLSPIVHVRTYLKGMQQWLWKAGKVGKSSAEFEISDLPPGTLYLELFEIREGETVHFVAPSAMRSRYSHIYYPGVTDIAEAGAIVLDPGEDRHLEVRVPKRQPGLVSVEITPRLGASRDDQLIVALKRKTLEDSFQTITATAEPAWHNPIRYSLVQGAYTVTARSEPGATSPSVGATSFSATGGEDNVRIELQPAFSLRGVILAEPDSGTPPTGDVVISLSTDDTQPEQYWSARTKIGEPFKIAGLFPGRYQVSASSLSGWAPARTEFGLSDALHQNITLPAESNLVVTMTSRLGALTGSVLDSDRPLDNALIVLVPEPIPSAARVDTFPIARLDDYGRYQFKDIAPGRYRVVPFYGRDLVRYRDLGAIREHARGYRDVDIKPNRTTNGVDFTVNH